MARQSPTSPLQGIYGILPADVDHNELMQKAEAALKGGVRMLQFRDKKQGYKRQRKRAQALRQLSNDYNAILIINDSIQLAQDCQADGVHLGRSDATNFKQVKSQLPDGFIMGVTCRADATFAAAAIRDGADYVSFGAVWASHSKPDVPAIGLNRLIKARQMFPNHPICAIGGITADNLGDIKAAGADCAALISGLFAADDIETEARKLTHAWNTPIEH